MVEHKPEVWICPPICEMEHTITVVGKMFRVGWVSWRLYARELNLYPSRVKNGTIYYRCQDIQRVAYERERAFVGIDYEFYRFLNGKRKNRPEPIYKREKFETKKPPKPRPLVPNTKGYVYLIKHGDYCKIGWTTNVENRIKGLAIIPGEFTLLHQFYAEKALATERALHKKYEAKHHYREWFDLDENDIREFQTLKDGDMDKEGVTDDTRADN